MVGPPSGSTPITAGGDSLVAHPRGCRPRSVMYGGIPGRRLEPSLGLHGTPCAGHDQGPYGPARLVCPYGPARLLCPYGTARLVCPYGTVVSCARGRPPGQFLTPPARTNSWSVSDGACTCARHSP